MPISAAGVVGQRLLDSRRSRSFLVLGLPADQLDRMTAVATGPQFRAREINVTRLLLQQMRAVNAEMKRPVPWEEVRRADAAPAHAKAGLGLRALVGRAVERVVAEINAQLAAPQPWDSPILLTDAAPLARYGHTKVLSQWSDLSRPRGQAVWLLVPKLAGRSGALLDGQPVQSSSDQFVSVDRVWIGRQWAELDREGVSA